MPYVIEFISSDTHELKKKVSKSLLYFVRALILTLILCYKRRHAQGLKSEILKTASYKQQQSQDSELLSYFSSFLVASKVLNKNFFAACS